MDDDKDDKDDDKTKKGAKKDDESLFEKDKDVAKAASAGTAGDFEPMKGSLDNAFDSNADKGESPAPNSTGKPDTPSGF
jgi:hypothetical protein